MWLRNILATLLVVAGLALIGAGCENELAGIGDVAASADASSSYGEAGDNCVPCPPGSGNAICCPLKSGGESFDPCFGSCGQGTVCDSKTQKCVLCDDGNPCTDDGYDATAKKCTVTPNSAQCEDGDKCTVGDKCAASKCVGGPAPDCTDNNSCTTDSCNPATGCVHTANDAICDDGNVCTGGEKCLNSQCVAGTPLSGGGCDDGNAGTVGDVCVVGVCKGSAPNCNDNNACTVDGGNPCTNTLIVCNDNNPCTDDSCDPATGCKFVNNTANCSDNNACTTGDKCGGGVCLPGQATSCDDNNACTDDSCDSATGCKHVNNTATCSDGSACTTGDKCGGGACLPGAATTCDDNNACTADSCVPATGCVNAAIPGCSQNGELCGNGVDDDGDGKMDCADTECNGASDAYTLHVFAQGGGTISIALAAGGSVEFQLPPQSPGPDAQLGTADDLGPMYFTFACSEVPFAAKVTGQGQTVVWVTSVTYVGGQPVFGGPPPAGWLPAFWWPWNSPVALNPGVPPAVVGQASFEMGGGGSLLVRWPPAQ